jgi:hypothetical protein
MVKGYTPDNGRQTVERVANSHTTLKSSPVTLSKPEIVPQSIVRPVRTGGCGGCGSRIL